MRETSAPRLLGRGLVFEIDEEERKEKQYVIIIIIVNSYDKNGGRRAENTHALAV